jgi:Protein of unknown function (DUF1761)
MIYLAIFVGALLATAFGFFWHMPFVFGKQWMEFSGIAPEKMAKANARYVAEVYGANLLTALVSVFVIYRFFDLLQINTVAGACEFILWVWLGFVVPIELGQTLLTGKSWKLFIINSLQYLGSYLLAVVVLILMIG